MMSMNSAAGPQSVIGNGIFGGGFMTAQQHVESYQPNSQIPFPRHSSHPAIPELAILVFEAVLEVVCVSLPGYIVARQGMFTAEMQKFTANLNVAVFTPCLIFTKLASQLTANRLADLAIIPVIFVVQTLVSYACSIATSKIFGLSKRPRNFVIAMGVFGNSNSLPISLVLSLSKTIRGLHWAKLPGDNDREVAARGILYLLIFQQLGQLVRWSWGYNVLLAPLEMQQRDTRTEEDSQLENGTSVADRRPLLDDQSDLDEQLDAQNFNPFEEPRSDDMLPNQVKNKLNASVEGDPSFSQRAAVPNYDNLFSNTSAPSSEGPNENLEAHATLTNGHIESSKNAVSFPLARESCRSEPGDMFHKLIRHLRCCKLAFESSTHRFLQGIVHLSTATFRKFPPLIQVYTKSGYTALKKFCRGVWSFMNPPLWAMLAAIVVASVPQLQKFFFKDGTFVKNSITSAIDQSSGVAVPLILVVLGGNLARNTLPAIDDTSQNDKQEFRLVVASLISRMLLPFLIMAPLLALTAKYIPVSILDDPIFVVVCFLITGAPTALQLAQICQVNNVYMGAMSRLLFQSYVIFILPSTLILVMCALEVVEWAQQ